MKALCRLCVKVAKGRSEEMMEDESQKNIGLQTGAIMQE